MRLPQGVKIERACGKDSSRTMLANPHLNVENGTLDATNSYIAVRVPVEVEEGDTSGYVSLLALKLASGRKLNKPIGCNGGLDIPEVGTLKRPEGVFPAIEKLMPEGEPAFEVGINAQLLADIAAALGPRAKHGVRLAFTAKDDGTPNGLRPIRVTPLGGPEAGEAILMPIRLFAS